MWSFHTKLSKKLKTVLKVGKTRRKQLGLLAALTSKSEVLTKKRENFQPDI